MGSHVHGIFSNGRLRNWGDPLSLFRFPDLTLLEKLRYGLFAFVCVRRNTWPAIEGETAHHWIHRWCGEDIYNKLWRSLFEFKFYEYAESISALWIWTRIRRIGRSRKNLMQEELGYLEGGSETLVKALTDALQRHGATLQLGTPVQKVLVQNNKAVGVETASGTVLADYVISTAPTPYIAAMVPDLPADWKARYEAIRNIGCICVVFKLRRSVSPHFWINISDGSLGIPGVIEFSNLRKVEGGSIVYVPYYMPVTNPKFSWTDEALLDEGLKCLSMINPSISRDDVIATKVARLKHGQPICEPGFAAKIPPVQTPIQGLQIADTCFYYPEDRGVAESIRLGRQMGRSVEAETDQRLA